MQNKESDLGQNIWNQGALKSISPTSQRNELKVEDNENDDVVSFKSD